MPEEESIKKSHPDQFLIRPCHLYKEEFHECERPKGRFHQYFIYGDYLDCNQWQTDIKNCNLWKESGDEQAYEELIASERKRRLERLKPHYQNDVWKKRDKPPENWNAPLPEWFEEQNKNSYLAVKARDIRNGTVDDFDMKMYNACSIL
ncbi:UPF0545 protein C22orf39 homolog [Nasonia vitripennis]|uniref:Synaptic plasticity regulator PANTS n=1 Tax=Nasonia vitripennis TaxID=7425 RepID=A0A7M7G4M9_NASVI|nr:UPF0545 protein C22orf39 homolog [Nasonia vitripennis]